MYLYFDKLGVLKTVIPHGEIPRQGSTLNIYVCLDDDFFESDDDRANHNVNIDLILPNNEVGTKNMLPQPGWPKLKMFMPVSSSEITYDFVPGVEYLTYHFKFEPEQSTAIAGRVIANISIVNIENDDENIEYFGRTEIFVEKTFGSAKVVVNEASLHYKNLVKQINQLNSKIDNIMVDSLPSDASFNYVKTKKMELPDTIFEENVDEPGSLKINDLNKNTIVKIDSNGITTTRLTLVERSLYNNSYELQLPEKNGTLATLEDLEELKEMIKSLKSQ